MIRIVSWNIRAGGGKRIDAIASQLQRWQPDIIALCEFRGTPPSQQLAQTLAVQGFQHQLMAIHSEKLAQNGLLLASRYRLTAVSHPHAPTEPQRWLLASVATPIPFTLGVMHIPNRVTKRKFPYHDAVLVTVDHWPTGLGLLVGDTNTGLPHLDEETRVFGPKEAGWIHALNNRGWRDLFRHLHGDKRAYTWYSPNGRNGFRLDQAFANPAFLPYVRAMRYQWGEKMAGLSQHKRDALSDHAAILLDVMIDEQPNLW